MKKDPARPFEVSKEQYPFEDHWFVRSGTPMHFVDQGKGTPVLMLHGNPTWSFLYRHIIKGLSGNCRSIAPDYPGFGFSGHPPGYGYTPQEHARAISELVDHLNLDQYILVVQDWGGPIGLCLATERPEKCAGLVILNTWCWAPAWDGKFFSWLLTTPLGKYLLLHRNLFAKRIVPSAIYKHEAKTPEILKAYTGPFPDPASRMGTYVFPLSIRKEADWLARTEHKLPLLAEKPMEMVWALKDPAFGKPAYISRWKSIFPDAPMEKVEKASHYLQEDCPEIIIAAIKRVLARLEEGHESAGG